MCFTQMEAERFQWKHGCLTTQGKHIEHWNPRGAKSKVLKVGPADPEEVKKSVFGGSSSGKTSRIEWWTTWKYVRSEAIILNLSFGYLLLFVFLSSPTYLDVLSIGVMVLSKVIVTSLKLDVNRHCYFTTSKVNGTIEWQVNLLLV